MWNASHQRARSAIYKYHGFHPALQFAQMPHPSLWPGGRNDLQVISCAQTSSNTAFPYNSDSHIFCVPCSNHLGLSSSANNVRICPACETQLGNPDDASVTQLNPTEDYKTSVLSGLSPSIIMECASRGMAFSQYQTTQEM